MYIVFTFLKLGNENLHVTYFRKNIYKLIHKTISYNNYVVTKQCETKMFQCTKPPPRPV